MRILVVEDEWLLAAHVEAVVTSAGHEVVAVARQLDEALSAAAAEHPDLAIMDLQLADGDCGVEVARQLKEQFGIRCLFLSGNIIKKEHKIRSLDLSPIAMLHKPLNDAMLTAALKAAEAGIADRAAGDAFVPDQAAASPEKD